MKKILFRKKTPVEIIKWLIHGKWVQVEILKGEDKGMRRPARAIDETIGKNTYESELVGSSLSKTLKKLPPVQF